MDVSNIPAKSLSDQNLWVTFRLDNEDYCVASKGIEAMSIPGEIKDMPNNPDHMLGVMRYNGTSIPIVELRTLFGMPTLADSIQNFTIMRQMHTDWIDALEDSVRNHKPFTKAVNPHQCKFGLWYDAFQTDNISLRFILNKIGPPHEYIHLHGAEVQKLMAQEDWEGAHQKYLEALDVCNNQVLPLLDDLIATYREVNRGIVIVMNHNGRTIGLLADEIDTLIPPGKAERHPVPKAIGHNPYIEALILYGNRTLAAIDAEGIMNVVDAEEARAEQIASAIASKGPTY